jgi:hypothetical protein
MPIAVGETSLRFTTLKVKLLDLGVRTVTPVTITADAAIAEGATSASLTASTAATVVPAGTALPFNEASPSGATSRKLIVTRADATLGTTPTSVSIFPARLAVPDTEEASFVAGLLPVFGLQEFSFQTQDQTVDTTDTLSGIGTEMAIVRSGIEFTMSHIERVADKGLTTIIKQVALDMALKGREVYAELVFADGETHKGAAKVMNYSQPGNQNEVKKVSYTLQFQGESYYYEPAYTFAA